MNTFCKMCGNKMLEVDSFCADCGARREDDKLEIPQIQPVQNSLANEVSQEIVLTQEAKKLGRPRKSQEQYEADKKTVEVKNQEKERIFQLENQVKMYEDELAIIANALYTFKNLLDRYKLEEEKNA